MKKPNKKDVLRLYASTLTMVLIAIIYFVAMWELTKRDLLEIMVVYVVFVLVPSFVIPMIAFDE